MAPTLEEEAAGLCRITDALAEPEAERLLAALDFGTWQVSRPPRQALVMMTAADPHGTAFHVGEVLVTEAGVARGPGRGFGVAVGDAPCRALLRAVIDLLGRLADPGGLARVRQLLGPVAERQAAEAEREARLLARTKVHFDLLPGR